MCPKDFESEKPIWIIWRALFTWLKLSDETSALLASAICSEFLCVSRSQIDSPLPCESQPPSIWYADEPTPHKKSDGNFLIGVSHPLKNRKRNKRELVNLLIMILHAHKSHKSQPKTFLLNLHLSIISGKNNIILEMCWNSQNKTIALLILCGQCYSSVENTGWAVSTMCEQR